MSALAEELIQKAKQTRATFLDLGNCGLTELPDSITDLVWLRHLNLGIGYYDEAKEQWVMSANGLKVNAFSKPNSLIKLLHLSELHILDLKYTGISDIGILAQLAQLQKLDLSYTKIIEIVMLAHLPHVQKLDLSGTQIRDIGVLAQLPQLQTLNLSRTEISNSWVLAQLPRLQTLNLSQTDVHDIEVLAQLPQLQALYLSGTQSRDIGVLAQLPKLQMLDLSHTQICDIGVLAQLPQLQALNLIGTSISEISVLAQLPLLQALDLGKTLIEDISVLAKMPRLQSLDLSGTSISDISVLAQRPLLQRLNLSSTEISDISVLALLPQLKTLNLSGTRVEDMKPLLPLIKAGIDVKWNNESWQGNGIYVEGCPLVVPPVDIVKQGNEAILNYFRQMDEQGGTLPLYEARLLMVGEPGAGKTSLTEKLLDENHQVIIDDPVKKSTLGINVRENWQFEDCQRPDEVFTAHIWDFGGQEIQYMTHQFFLTPESFYVLVADDRKQHTLFPYWFEAIRLLGKDEQGRNSPILVVLNERNHKSITNFDLNAYRLKYPDLQIEMLEVDLGETNLYRFRTVRDKIQQSLCSLSHVGRQLPKKWPSIRQAIQTRNDTDNYLTRQQFADICAQSGVTRAEDQQLISKYLHQLGVLLHFQQDPSLRDFIIINPTWALKAVYAVLEDKEVERNQGRFTSADLDRYWAGLTDDERVNILSLMKKDNFEICYPIDSQTYIAPQLLPGVRPVFSWDSRQTLKCQFFYRFMPKGIITRLIVRQHEYLKDQALVWSRGAMFQRFGCDILVTEDETEKNGLIAIEVSGPAGNRIRALDFIRNDLEDIHKKWFTNIDYEERAPCNCTDCTRSATPTFFSWKSLSKYVEQNIETINCENGLIKPVPVIPLLEGIYDKTRIEQLRRARKPDYIPEFDELIPPVSPTPQPTDSMNTENKVPETPKPPVGNKTNWLVIVLVAALVALVFFMVAKPGSKLDFFGWFKAEQGSETGQPKKEEAAGSHTATIVGSVVVNGRNVSAEDVKQVRVKDQTLVQPARLSNNRFLLREVEVPKDRLLEIAIDFNDGRSASEVLRLPKVNQDNVIDLREVLLEVRMVPAKKGRNGSPSRPVIIIKNQNIQNN